MVCKAKICHTHVKFKINTGADISVINRSTDNNLCDGQPLRPKEGIFKNSGGILSCERKFKTSTTKEIPTRSMCT